MAQMWLRDIIVVEISVRSKSLQRVFADTADLLTIKMEKNALAEKVAERAIMFRGSRITC